jgi:hypothetical protein
MHAVKLQVVVPESRELRIILPPEVSPGKAEVIILTDTQHNLLPGSWERIRHFLDHTPPAHPGRTKEEIDLYLQEERSSWGDDE